MSNNFPKLSKDAHAGISTVKLLLKTISLFQGSFTALQLHGWDFESSVKSQTDEHIK